MSLFLLNYVASIQDSGIGATVEGAQRCCSHRRLADAKADLKNTQLYLSALWHYPDGSRLLLSIVLGKECLYCAVRRLSLFRMKLSTGLLDRKSDKQSAALTCWTGKVFWKVLSSAGLRLVLTHQCYCLSIHVYNDNCIRQPMKSGII